MTLVSVLEALARLGQPGASIAVCVGVISPSLLVAYAVNQIATKVTVAKVKVGDKEVEFHTRPSTK